VEAFNCLVSRWEKRLYNYLLRLLSGQPGCREDSLDLCQEAFLKAYQSIATLQDEEKFPQWLFRIAHNLAFSQLRRPALVESMEAGGEQEWGENLAGDWREARSVSRSGTARPVFGLEMEFAVSKALETLTPEQREAIVLKIYHGFQFAEIAEIISCPLSTVKSRIYAGFAQLRAMLAEEPARPVALRQRR
jgi:RNA polymerase sigma-70 factor (ECF subfamily)